MALFQKMETGSDFAIGLIRARECDADRSYAPAGSTSEESKSRSDHMGWLASIAAFMPPDDDKVAWAMLDTAVQYFDKMQYQQTSKSCGATSYA